MKPTGDKQTILAQFADGPAQLEKAIQGLSESDLDIAPLQGGWSIREIIHHIADGDDIWKSGIKMAMGTAQVEMHLDWYGAFPQTSWASHWAYAQRPVDTSIELLKLFRRQVLELLAQRPDAWDKSVEIRDSKGQTERITVGFIVEMQATHVFHHMKRIQAIRQERGA